MKMKRIVLMLVGALLALGISAQTFTNGEWRVDSIITTQKDGKVVARQIMQYNAAGLTLDTSDKGPQYIALAQATDCLKIADKLSPATRRQYDRVRALVPVFVEDAPFYDRIALVETMLRGGKN